MREPKETGDRKRHLQGNRRRRVPHPHHSSPGLLESVYHTVLAYELAQRGLHTVSQQAIPVVYGTVQIDTGFRADLIVEDQVIVEIKSVEVVAPVHRKQLLTYLRLADKRLGLLINFNTVLIKDGYANRERLGRSLSRQVAHPPRTHSLATWS